MLKAWIWKPSQWKRAGGGGGDCEVNPRELLKISRHIIYGRCCIAACAYVVTTLNGWMRTKLAFAILVRYACSVTAWVVGHCTVFVFVDEEMRLLATAE